jgi:hypothetical protein
MKLKIYETILKIEKELDTECSKQRRRHLENELERLLEYIQHHPDAEYTPSSLELFCDENPDALECRVYED